MGSRPSAVALVPLRSTLTSALALPIHGKSSIPCSFVHSRHSNSSPGSSQNRVVTTSETQRRGATCPGSHSVSVHRQGQPDVELGVYLQGHLGSLFFSRPLHGLEGSFPTVTREGTWSTVSQDAVSGPLANVTVWEWSPLESQVAEEPTPGCQNRWRTQRADTVWGGGQGRTCPLAPCS